MFLTFFFFFFCFIKTTYICQKFKNVNKFTKPNRMKTRMYIEQLRKEWQRSDFRGAVILMIVITIISFLTI